MLATLRRSKLNGSPRPLSPRSRRVISSPSRGSPAVGKTTTARRIRQDLEKERKILVATNLAVDKERVKLGTLMEAIFADIRTDKEAALPTQAELRGRRLRDLIQRRGRPVALFIDEAHDLHTKMDVG